MGSVKRWFGIFVGCQDATDAGGVNGGAPAAAVAARTHDLDDVGRDGAMILLTKNPGMAP
jgi:hypothetical protein